jgi:GH15 family glucan-1,4-alpha-glucosidase
MAGYYPLREYGIIGGGSTAALVHKNGSIDWCCWPRFDSGAVFCRLLDARRGGFFSVAPAGRFSATHNYRGDTNVLATEFKARSRFRLTDFMPAGYRSSREPRQRMLRLLEGLSGASEVEIVLRPTFDFGRVETRVSAVENGVVATGGGERVSLSCPAEFKVDGNGAARAKLRLREGERVWLALVFGQDLHEARVAAVHGEIELERTLAYWEDWIRRCNYEGLYRDQVRRSALALKALIYEQSGAMVAAPTTSLPERIGGVRNWDYRYTWLRDAGLVVRALEAIGYYDEANNFFEWMEDLDLRWRDEIQIMYTVTGGSELIERTVDHLEGYRRSRPVHTGNGASTHVQLDIFGEVFEAATHALTKMGRKLRGDTWALLTIMADTVAAGWRSFDRSIWERRGEPRDYVYSKLMCWVALDRAIALRREYGLRPGQLDWDRAAAGLRHAILTRGYNKDVGAFTQSFDSDQFDASALAIPRVGFLPADDPRVVSTCERIRKHLMNHGLVYRYRNDDGLPSGEGTFSACGFWLADNLAGQGRLKEARETFERIVKHAGELGLLSEEIDPSSGELLGNYPQAFTHLALIRSAVNLAEVDRKRTRHAGGGR